MSYENSYCLALCGFYSVREADASTTLKLQRYLFNFPPTLLNSIAGPGSLIFSSLSCCFLGTRRSCLLWHAWERKRRLAMRRDFSISL